MDAAVGIDRAADGALDGVELHAADLEIYNTLASLITKMPWIDGYVIMTGVS